MTTLTLTASPLDAFRRPLTPPGSSPPMHGPDDWGRAGTLADHVHRHGGDFGTADPERYARLAHAFMERAQHTGNGLEVKVDRDDGTFRIYDPQSDAFGSYNADDSTRTYFKPHNGQAYFDRQPGAVVATAPFPTTSGSPGLGRTLVA